MGIIYQITNKVNNEFYIGKTKKSLDKRFRGHMYNVKYGIQTHLYNAIRKYGKENFECIVLEETDFLDEREKHYIEILSPQYNMTQGGDGGDTSKSENFQSGVKLHHLSRSKSSYATFGMQGKKQSTKFLSSIKKANSCPVMCEGVRYESVQEAQSSYPGISIRKRLDSPKYPQFYRLREKTRRK